MSREAQSILITGAGTGIGRATATALRARGHRVFGTSRDPARVQVKQPEIEWIPMDQNARHRGTMTNTHAARSSAASQRRREQEKQALRQIILDAAGEIFLAQGYAGFSLRQVAERIGYSATTIYLYFSDKEDLLFTLADEGFQRFGERLARAAVEEADPLARLQTLGQAYVAFGTEEPTYYQLMFMQRGDFLLGCRPGATEPRIDTLGILRQTFEAAIAAGEVRAGDAARYADLFWAFAHGVVALQISVPVIDRARAQATLTLGLRTLIAGLIP